MTTTPQEPGSEPHVDPSGDPVEPNPPSPTEPGEGDADPSDTAVAV